MQITRNAALNQVNEYFVGWMRPVIIFNSRKIDDNFLTVFFLLLQDQYQLCYRAALEYLGSFDHYAT